MIGDVQAMTGLVLAGGRSRRMGRDKALLPIGGRRLVDHVAARLAEVCDEVLIASGERRLPDVRWRQIPDVRPDAGPLAGILAGLAAATTPLVAVAGVDMPAVSPDLYVRLAELHERPAARSETPRHPHAAAAAVGVLPVVAGRPQALHAVYATAALPRLAALMAAGERSPTAALLRLGVRTVDVDDPAGATRSVNTPEDLRRLAGRLATGAVAQGAYLSRSSGSILPDRA